MSSPRFKLWCADPHDFGPGKIHVVLVGEEERLFCGRLVADVPGHWREVSPSCKATCKICIRVGRRRFPHLVRSAA